MIIRKVLEIGGAVGLTLPPPYLHAAKIGRGDIVTIQLGANDDIIIRRVDLKALAAQRKKDDKARK